MGARDKRMTAAGLVPKKLVIGPSNQDRRVERKKKRRLRHIRNGAVRADRAERMSKLKETRNASFAFYDSDVWMELRYRVLKFYGRKCCLCRTTKGIMHADHIKPRSKHPELALEFDNLQVLCRACNLGKGNSDDTDWRST